jgi:hypothetical protein
MFLQLFSWLGMLLSLVGTTMLFKYGFPQPSFSEGSAILAEGPDVDADAEKAREEKIKYKRISTCAFALIFFGFIFQTVAMFIPLLPAR